jgi:hypothetical protein
MNLVKNIDSAYLVEIRKILLKSSDKNFGVSPRPTCCLAGQVNKVVILRRLTFW